MKKQLYINENTKQELIKDFDCINALNAKDNYDLNKESINIKSILIPLGSYDLTKKHLFEISRLLSKSQNLNSNIIVIITYYKNYHFEEKIYLSSHSYFETMFGSKLQVNKNLRNRLIGTKNTKLNEYITFHERNNYNLNMLYFPNKDKIEHVVEKDSTTEFNYEDYDNSLDLIISCISLWFKSIEIFPIWISTFNEEAITQLMLEINQITNQKYLTFCLGNVNQYHLNLPKSISLSEENNFDLVELIKKRLFYKKYSQKLDISLTVLYAFEKTYNKSDENLKIEQVYFNNTDNISTQNDVVSLLSCIIYE